MLDTPKQTTIISFSISLLVSLIFTPLARNVYKMLNPYYYIGDISSIGLGELSITIFLFLLIYFFTQPFTNSLLLPPKDALLKSIWELLVVTALTFIVIGLPVLIVAIPFLVLSKDFLPYLGVAILGFFLGLGIRTLHEKLMP